MRIARRYVIKGRVQGVGFRYFMQLTALEEHVSGWVRNTGDGDVQAEAEGDAAALMRFEARLRTGPAGARVDAVEASDIPAGTHSGEFRVR